MLKRFFAVVCAIALFGAAPTGYPGSADDQYVALAREYFSKYFETSPIAATQAGVHTYDAQLGDFSAAGVRAQLQSDKEYLAALKGIDRSQLSPEVQLDAQLLENSLNDDLLLNGQLAQWQHNPDVYTQAASGAVFVLLSRDFAPLPDRMRSAIARERAIPAMLADARKNVSSVDAVTQEISADDAAGSVAFFTHSVPAAFAAVQDAALQGQLKSANAAAASAMRSYAAWIKTLKPTGTFAIGRDAYQKRLLYEDGLSMPLAGYLAVGKAALAQTRQRFIAVAKQIDAHKTPLQVYLGITKVHPSPAQLLPKAQHDLIALRAFVEQKHLVTLPADANIKVVETPEFERDTTEAAEDSPGPLETVATQAYYYVTPVNASWNAKQKEEFLAEFNDYEFPIISAHEVYPGHFTNFSIDRHLDLSLTRKMLVSSEFAEGWAHYDEQMMVDEGWGNSDPKVRLAQLDEALLRNCRYVVGVGLHTGAMTVDQAEHLFTDQCFQTKQIAVGETLRGTQDPMYGYYALGKLMILKLREDYKKKLGADFTLQKFHDALLAHGDPPLPYLRPILLGSDDDGKPL